MRSTATGFLVCLLLSAVVSPPAGAATWIVDQGGGGDATTVGGGLALASYGDTVLVNPGTYSTNVSMVNGVVLLSAGGPAATVLDGGGSSPIVLCTSISSEAVIEGFTLTHARGDSVGGAVVCLVSSSPRIRGNVFRENASLYGAAIGCASGSSPIIEDNLFEDNTSDEEAGAIVAIHNTSLIIRRNEFRNNRATTKSGGAVWIGDDSPALILDNIFLDNACQESGGAIWIGRGTAVNIQIERNLFVRNQAGVWGGAIYGGLVYPEINSNTFFANTAQGSYGGALFLNVDSGLIFENNIVARSHGVAVAVRNPSTIDCNDFWQNFDGDLDGWTHGSGDFFLSPEFCDFYNDNFMIAQYSPCVTGFGCGLVGAYGVGCDATLTESTTWGRVKTRFE